MRKLFVVGMGAGSVGHLTLDAVDTLRAVDVVFVLEKAGAGKDELGRLRRELLERVVPEGTVRLEVAPSPERTIDEAAYGAGIEDWRRSRAAVVEELIVERMAEGEAGAFLVWGDPCLYDGTIQILEDLQGRGLDLAFEVVPGISSVQALTARHRVTLNRIGESVTITTARQLAATAPGTITNSVVMLDGRAAFKKLAESDLDIYWGAYLGTADEVLVAGPLRECAREIEQLIERERRRKGWIMDTYLLRRP